MADQSGSKREIHAGGLVTGPAGEDSVPIRILLGEHIYGPDGKLLTVVISGESDVTVTEWGCRYDEEFVQRVHDEAMARKVARAGKSLGHVAVSRKVTIGPWEELPDER